MIKSIEEYAPDFEKLIIGRDMLFPSDLEEQFSLTGTLLPSRIFFTGTFLFQVEISSMAHFHLTNSIRSDRRYHVLTIELPSTVSIFVVVQLIPEVNEKKQEHHSNVKTVLGGVTGMPGFNAASIILKDWAHKKYTSK